MPENWVGGRGLIGGGGWGGRWLGGEGAILGGGAIGGGGMFSSFGGFGGPMIEQMRPMPPLPKADIVVAPKDLAPVQQTRKLFPETWLWKSQIVPYVAFVNVLQLHPITFHVRR
ncbi:hypothetical protein DPMN_049610 [Dreissena polymorpha]|uniref:Uncharacterized protein n=1 Tax=Dreissena polymorpha TaxID=45954 RepID=A0A9D4CGF9_DREPO|nr:hypothetical protein DPMN_049610 [Dreissena polymorpha]